jgi:endonuclease YncB( thermonuclease family)
VNAAPLLLALLLVGAQAEVGRLVGTHFEARVVRIADGDTIELIPVGQTRAIRIRFEGVDAPETGEVFSREAQALIRSLLLNQHVGVDGHDVDRYGRLVARVSAGGKDASLELIKAGLACHRFAPDSGLAAAEAQARASGSGFWAATATKPQCVALSAQGRRMSVPPRSSAPGTANPGRAAAAPRPTTGTLHGNVSSHVYHTAACANFTCRNCTRVFTSETEAQAAGFSPAGDCARPRP